MNAIFATSVRSTALDYLKKAYPSYEITEEIAKPILDMVSAKKIRIGDPMMYPRIPVFPDKNYEPSDMVILKKWQDNLK